MIYRFRVTYEEHEDVYRDIDIKASQTFSDLHNIIQQSISFDNSKPASFFSSDDYWRREEEISITLKQEDKKPKRHEEPPRRKAIADYVNNPHQRFIYVFDPEKEWTFQIELLKILPEDGSLSYPLCVKSSGNAPKQYKETTLPPPPPEDEEDEPKKVKDQKEKLMEDAEEKAAVQEEDDEDRLPMGDEDVKTGEEETEEEPSGKDDEDGEEGDEEIGGFNLDEGEENP